MINEIIISELGINDEAAQIIHRCYNNYDYVKKGSLICELETTKTVFELYSEHEGYIHWIVQGNNLIKIQSVVAIVSDKIDEIDCYLSKEVPIKSIKITKKAQALLDKYNIKVEDITKCFDKTLREADVLNYIGQDEIDNEVEVVRPEYLSKIAVMNATGGGISVVETAIAAGVRVIYILDDNLALGKREVFGIPIISADNFIELYRDSVEGVFVHLQKNRKRDLVRHFERLGMKSPTIVHPKSVVSASAKLGKGVLVKAGAIIDTESIIHEHAIIDNGVVIPHHCVIGKYSHISPGSSMGGHVRIEEDVVVGIGASISPGVVIGRGSIILPGTVIRKNVPEYSIIDGIDNKVGVAKKL